MPRILGLDYGDRHLGFALSDPDGTIAFPHTTAHVRDEDQAVSQIARVCAESKAQRLVIGLPLNMDGTQGPRAQATHRIVERLARRIGIPISTWDERLTTRTAEAALIEAGASRKRRKQVVDKLAAQILLQAYLDAQSWSERLP